MATEPVLATSTKPKSFIKVIKASSLCEAPVNSKIKDSLVLSTTLL